MPASKLFIGAKHAFDRFEERRVPAHIASKFRGTGDERLRRDRLEIIPWLDGTRELNGSRIVEVGSGPGESTVALAEQGARVTGIDVGDVEEARARCAEYGVEAELITANASDLGSVIDQPVDWVIFWASLEHMTIEERLTSLEAAWRLLPTGGLLTVIESPNRLWLYDSHTSLLPYFHWLPDELAYQYSRFSPRVGFNDAFQDSIDDKILSFVRLGRGVSVHEFHLAIGLQFDVVGCMQLERRARNPLRALGWSVSEAGRYERCLRSQSPSIPRAFFQPFLYLTIRR
jgi:S-adenosylmethionine-dependent methyltransferase